MNLAERRRFLQWVAAGGTVATLGDLGFLGQLPRVSAAEAALDTEAVRFAPEVEPLVQLIEESSREQLLEKVAAEIRSGRSYQEVLAALLLAGIRNVQPRPSVGFKFHAVLVVNSAHLASMASPDEHRWLPIFWALDYFKSAQAQDVRENNWTMSRVEEARVPAGHRARGEFIAAMDNWDEPAADAAVAGLARTHGAGEIYELLFRYGARDFRSIGHKAIYVANSWRTLQCIGWQHAEPVLRSLAYALLMHEGENPARRNAEADLPWRQNEQRAEEIREDWYAGRMDSGATRELLETLREASHDEACAKTVELLNRGIAPQSLWDAILVSSGELLVRQPGIVALHALTTANALRFAYQASGQDRTRRMLLLQNAAFVPMFREAMRGRGEVRDFQLEQLQPSDSPGDSQQLLNQLLADISANPLNAAQEVLAFLRSQGDPRQLMDAARVLVFLKGNDAHDYKFSSAVLEDYYHVSPEWRDLFLASSVFKLCGAGEPDNRLVERTRAAFA